jgi:uncharacterized protein (TIGR00369 family)
VNARASPSWVRREYEPANPDYARLMRLGERLQTVIEFVGMRLAGFGPGWAEMEVDYRRDITNEMGPVHGGILATLADTAAGFASYSLVAAGENTLTVSYAINFLAPALGGVVVARAQVLKPGRTILVVGADVIASEGGVEKACASFTGTFMRVKDTSALSTTPADR